MKQRNKQQIIHRRVVWVVIILALVLLALSWLPGRRLARSRAQSAPQRVTAPKLTPRKTKQVAVTPKLVGTRDENLQSQLTTKLQAIDFIGSAIIVRNGQIVAQWANGYANASTRQVNNLQTQYNINSMQKCLTGILVMQEVARGRLALTDNLAKFYSQVPHSSAITLRQMLNMMSGLTMAGMGSEPYQSDRDTIAADIARTEFSASSYNQSNYQPINYVLLVGILEQVTGKSYQDLFNENIKERLHLQHTDFGYDLPAGKNIARGYANASYAGELAVDANQQHLELGTGQLYMSVSDYYLVLRNALDGNLVTTTMASELFTGAYGGGLYNPPTGIKFANGAGVNFGSTIRISPDGQTAILMFSNGFNSYNQMKAASIQLDTAVFTNRLN